MSGFEPKSGSKLQSIWKHRFFIVTLQSDSDEDAKRRPREAETDDRKERTKPIIVKLKFKKKRIMASEVIAFPVNLRRNQNKYNAAYGKYYAEADSMREGDLR
jgi:hypothetical protein